MSTLANVPSFTFPTWNVVRPIALTLFILLILPPHALAQAIGDQRCKDQQYISSQVNGLLGVVRRIGDEVETVPPDEAEYIHHEAGIALDQRNEGRFNAVAGRHYYAALQFHDDANVVTRDLITGRSASGSGHDLAQHLVSALSDWDDMNSALKSYIDADRKHTPRMLTDKSGSEMSYNLIMTKGLLVGLLQCVISSL